MKENESEFKIFVLRFLPFLNLCNEVNKKKQTIRNNQEIMIEFINNVVPKLTTQWGFFGFT